MVVGYPPLDVARIKIDMGFFLFATDPKPMLNAFGSV